MCADIHDGQEAKRSLQRAEYRCARPIISKLSYPACTARPVHTKVHGQGRQTTGPKPDDLPAQPRSRVCRRGPVRRADDRLQAALLYGISRRRSEGARSPRGNGASNGRVGCAADERGRSMGHSAKISVRDRDTVYGRVVEATPACAGYSEFAPGKEFPSNCFYPGVDVLESEYGGIRRARGRPLSG